MSIRTPRPRPPTPGPASPHIAGAVLALAGPWLLSGAGPLPPAVGIAWLLVARQLAHALEMRRHELPTGLLAIVPIIGEHKTRSLIAQQRDPRVQARIALAGAIALALSGCAILAHDWLAGRAPQVAALGLTLGLINLVQVRPLDGAGMCGTARCVPWLAAASGAVATALVLGGHASPVAVALGLLLTLHIGGWTSALSRHPRFRRFPGDDPQLMAANLATLIVTAGGVVLCLALGATPFDLLADGPAGDLQSPVAAPSHPDCDRVELGTPWTLDHDVPAAGQTFRAHTTIVVSGPEDVELPELAVTARYRARAGARPVELTFADALRLVAASCSPARWPVAAGTRTYASPGAAAAGCGPTPLPVLSAVEVIASLGPIAVIRLADGTERTLVIADLADQS